VVVGVVTTTACESRGDGIIIGKPAVVGIATVGVRESCGTSSGMSIKLGCRVPTWSAIDFGGFSSRVFSGPVMEIPVIVGVVRVGVPGAVVGTDAIFIK